MQTVNQSVVGILVSLLLGGCVTRVPVATAGTNGLGATSARWISPGSAEWPVNEASDWAFDRLEREGFA